MKNLIKENQSKKIRRYVDVSLFLSWYRENKQRIGAIIGVSPSNLPSVGDVMGISRGLINDIINPQSMGVKSNDFRGGFPSFVKLEYILIHDFLHNLYNVDIKEFEKDLDAYEFSVSEIVEEIECLAIEETYMKYMNRSLKSLDKALSIEKSSEFSRAMSKYDTYTSTDFTNQNINNLASYLAIAIMKEQPNAVELYLKNGNAELEVYGKSYPVNGTPFENVFKELLGKVPKDIYDNSSDRDDMETVSSIEDLKKFLIKIIGVGEYIDDNFLDRARFPDDIWWAEEFDGSPDHLEKAAYETRYEDGKPVVGKFGVVEKRPTLDFKYEFEEIEKREGEEGLGWYIVGDEEFVGDEDEEPLEYDSKYWYSEYDGKIIKDLDDAFSSSQEVSQWQEQYEESIGYEPDVIAHLKDNDIHEFLDSSNLQGIIEWISEEASDDTRAILRRYFRESDVISNNTKSYFLSSNSMGKFGSRRFDTESLSKKAMTDNAKNLIKILDEFRGYTIKNFKTVKDRFKKLYDTSNVEKMNISEEQIDGIVMVYNTVTDKEKMEYIEEWTENSKYLKINAQKNYGTEIKFNVTNTDQLKKFISTIEFFVSKGGEPKIDKDTLELLNKKSDETLGGVDLVQFSDIVGKAVKEYDLFDKVSKAIENFDKIAKSVENLIGNKDSWYYIKTNNETFKGVMSEFIVQLKKDGFRVVDHKGKTITMSL